MPDAERPAGSAPAPRLLVDFGLGAAGGAAVLAVFVAVLYLISNVQQRLDAERNRC